MWRREVWGSLLDLANGFLECAASCFSIWHRVQLLYYLCFQPLRSYRLIWFYCFVWVHSLLFKVLGPIQAFEKQEMFKSNLLIALVVIKADISHRMLLIFQFSIRVWNIQIRLVHFVLVLNFRKRELFSGLPDGHLTKTNLFSSSIAWYSDRDKPCRYQGSWGRA